MKYLQIFIIIILATFSQLTFAQTKRIMHRSHSGSNTSFSTDESEDNFGLTRAMEMYQDSVYAAQQKKEKDSINAAQNKKNKDSSIKKPTSKATVPKKTDVKPKNSKKQ